MSPDTIDTIRAVNNFACFPLLLLVLLVLLLLRLRTDRVLAAVHVPGNRCAKLDDFVDFETGANRLLRQQAVVDTVLALAEQVTWTVNSMTSGRDSSISSRTIWPRLDEIHLGNVSDGDAFAELSLMPMDYFHQRTVTATTNTSLYYLEKDSL